MLAFWPEVIRSLFDALNPGVIVEVGSEHGKTLERVLGWAHDHDAIVHSVDPAPRYDVEAWKAKHLQLRVHELPSLVALSAIGAMDAVLIDGDHNYFTVHAELELIETRHRQLDAPLPIILLHDVGWPYGRRDLYYDPKRIPAEHRHPFAQGGVHPTEKGLVPHGINGHLWHARDEGGAKNGVLTAVEDYLKTTSESYLFAKVPAVYGLGILLPETRAQLAPEAHRLVDTWATVEVERFIERLEMARIAMMTGARG